MHQTASLASWEGFQVADSFRFFSVFPASDSSPRPMIARYGWCCTDAADKSGDFAKLDAISPRAAHVRQHVLVFLRSSGSWRKGRGGRKKQSARQSLRPLPPV